MTKAGNGSRLSAWRLAAPGHSHYRPSIFIYNEADPHGFLSASAPAGHQGPDGARYHAPSRPRRRSRQDFTPAGEKDLHVAWSHPDQPVLRSIDTDAILVRT